MNQRVIETVAKSKMIMGIAEQVSEDFKFYVPFWSDNRILYSHPEVLKVIAKESAK